MNALLWTKLALSLKSTDTKHIFVDQGEFSDKIQMKLKIEMH